MSERLFKNAKPCFDRLSTNGNCSLIPGAPPFALSLSKGGQRVFQQLLNQTT
jgi:hypothetical protein